MPVLDIVLLVVFTLVLAKSAQIVVEHADKLSKFFGISTLAIGMLLISSITTLPELSVSIISSAAKQGDIAAGNAVGSVICNMLFILGLGAFLYGFKVEKNEKNDAVLLAVTVAIICAYVLVRTLVIGGAIGFWEGAILLLIWAWNALRLMTRRKVEERRERGAIIEKSEGLKSFLVFVAGVAVVLVSAAVVVDSAVHVADDFGLAKGFIGATIIAIGTSLPELSIILQAIRMKKYGIAVGNAVGANMADMTLVLGVAVIMNPISAAGGVLVTAFVFGIITNAAFLYFVLTKGKFGKREGAILLLLYAIYLVSIFYLQAAK
ncbi:MAG: hypothetical protein NTV88_02145 [Candidatus Micrarchaeota archaeon]|nr:hypothetical protein [Candidatus Micrarchaeota archaeon]